MYCLLQKNVTRLSTVRSCPRYSCSKLVLQYSSSLSTSSSPAGPLKEYHRLVAGGTISEDSHQLAALAKLQRLYEQVIIFDAKVGHRSSSSADRTTVVDEGNSASPSMSVGNIFQSWFGTTSASTSTSQQPSSPSLFSSRSTPCRFFTLSFPFTNRCASTHLQNYYIPIFFEAVILCY